MIIAAFIVKNINLLSKFEQEKSQHIFSKLGF